MFSEQDHYFMGLAISQAEQAAKEGEVPVGAVLVHDGKLIASAYNMPIALNDPSAHAEILVLRAAAKILENYRLPGSELFVTIEPCLMCAGALIHSRVKRLIFGASEPKAGVAKSQIPIFEADFVNHKIIVEGGLREEECANLIKGFFKQKREFK